MSSGTAVTFDFPPGGRDINSELAQLLSCALHLGLPDAYVHNLSRSVVLVCAPIASLQSTVLKLGLVSMAEGLA